MQNNPLLKKLLEELTAKDGKKPQSFSGSAAIRCLDRLKEEFPFQDYEACAKMMEKIEIASGIPKEHAKLFRDKFLKSIYKELDDLYEISERNKKAGFVVVIETDTIEYRINSAIESACYMTPII